MWDRADMFISKQQAKNKQRWQNKRKQASANWCNTLVFIGENASTKPSQNIKKTFTNTTKRIVVMKITYVKTLEHKKKQKMTRRNCETPGSVTEANLHTTKRAKVRNLA